MIDPPLDETGHKGGPEEEYARRMTAATTKATKAKGRKVILRAERMVHRHGSQLSSVDQLKAMTQILKNFAEAHDELTEAGITGSELMAEFAAIVKCSVGEGVDDDPTSSA